MDICRDKVCDVICEHPSDGGEFFFMNFSLRMNRNKTVINGEERGDGMTEWHMERQNLQLIWVDVLNMKIHLITKLKLQPMANDAHTCDIFNCHIDDRQLKMNTQTRLNFSPVFLKNNLMTWHLT